MKTYAEHYALTMPKVGHTNRKRHTRFKTIALRIAITLAIGAGTYYASAKADQLAKIESNRIAAEQAAKDAAAREAGEAYRKARNLRKVEMLLPLLDEAELKHLLIAH